MSIATLYIPHHEVLCGEMNCSFIDRLRAINLATEEGETLLAYEEIDDFEDSLESCEVLFIILSLLCFAELFRQLQGQDCQEECQEASFDP